MDLLTALLLALSLSMDSFAVAITQGIKVKHQKLSLAVKIGVTFGLIQAGMPLIGFLIGATFSAYIAAFDHWVAFILLSIIGIKMIHEALQKDSVEAPTHITFQQIVLLAIATSIDALVVGVTLGVLQANLLQVITIIGVVTALFSFSGVLLGNMLGNLFSKKMEILGGSVLIGIGFKILLEHFF